MTNPRPAPFFVGEHLALDFLNSTAAPWGEPIEWLADGYDLLAWLESARALDADGARHLRLSNDIDTLDAVASQARSLREWLREFVSCHAGRSLDAEVLTELEPLNRLLAQSDSYRQLAATDPGDDAPSALMYRQRWRWTNPEQLLQPLAEMMGDLVCQVDFRLVRLCEGSNCTLWFHDTTKSHARRWCSRAVCGNRAKAAAHRARRKSQD